MCLSAHEMVDPQPVKRFNIFSFLFFACFFQLGAEQAQERGHISEATVLSFKSISFV